MVRKKIVIIPTNSSSSFQFLHCQPCTSTCQRFQPNKEKKGDDTLDKRFSLFYPSHDIVFYVNYIDFVNSK